VFNKIFPKIVPFLR